MTFYESKSIYQSIGGSFSFFKIRGGSSSENRRRGFPFYFVGGKQQRSEVKEQQRGSEVKQQGTKQRSSKNRGRGQCFYYTCGRSSNRGGSSGSRSSEPPLPWPMFFYYTYGRSSNWGGSSGSRSSEPPLPWPMFFLLHIRKEQQLGQQQREPPPPRLQCFLFHERGSKEVSLARSSAARLLASAQQLHWPSP